MSGQPIVGIGNKGRNRAEGCYAEPDGVFVAGFPVSEPEGNEAVVEDFGEASGSGVIGEEKGGQILAKGNAFPEGFAGLGPSMLVGSYNRVAFAIGMSALEDHDPDENRTESKW
jgi:hypothetical protein